MLLYELNSDTREKKTKAIKSNEPSSAVHILTYTEVSWNLFTKTPSSVSR